MFTDAVRLNLHTKNATESDVTFNIKKWLVRCRDRIQAFHKSFINV